MRVLKRLGLALALVVLFVAGLVGFAWWRSSAAMQGHYEIADAHLTVDGSSAQIERGRHLATTRGCTDCHGADLSGTVLIDAPPIGRIVAPNLTAGGRGAHFTTGSLEHAIRHAVAYDGRPLVFMPAEDWTGMSDADVAAIIAFVQAAPRVDKLDPPLTVGPLARVLWLFGKFPLLPAETIAHQQTARTAPPVAVSVEYGRYVAQACFTCHGPGLSGGHVPGTPPEFKDAANITPDPSGIQGWTEADFFRALRDGKRPDGSALDDFMPWKAMGKMDDTELGALWVYLQSVPPRPRGTR